MSAQLPDFQAVVGRHAEWFASLSADQQVEFLRRSAEAMLARCRGYFPEGSDIFTPELAADRGWHALGSHVRNCGCADAETEKMIARMLLKILEGMLVGTGE